MPKLSIVLRRIAKAAALIVAFFIAVIAEVGIRALTSKPIPFSIAEDVKADVEASVMPDFLWIGSDWFVSIKSAEPVSVEFDGQWKARVPAGKHTLYHNHDSNNTLEYATTRLVEPPKVVTLSKP